MSALRAALLRAVIGPDVPAASDLCRALESALMEAGAAGAPVAITALKSRVYRLNAGSNGQRRSVVLKRFDPWLARRNELVARRWLPALGLGDRCPRLLATAADPRGRSTWHVYEDLGDGALDATHPDPERVTAVVRLLAELHTRAARHPVIPECRHYCGNLGAPFFAANVRDALAVVEALAPPRVQPTSEQGALRDRLLVRLRRLRDQEPERTRRLEESGQPDTLLHGDLWTTNALVTASGNRLTARLIDWDHAAAGPCSYDLSTFLYRFARAQRPAILAAYRRALGEQGADWSLPPDEELAVLFETAELARYANRVIWPAAAVLEDGATWGWEQLAEVERWFDALEPALSD